MSGTLSKLIASLIVLTWAILNIFPINDTPFVEYIKSKPTAKPLEFSEILKKAEVRVQDHKSPSVFVALSEIGKEEHIDFSVFFPKIHLADVKNLDKRNEILLRHLLQSGQGKIKLGLDLKGGTSFTLKIDESALEGKEAFQKTHQLAKAIDIIDQRVNGLGVAEPIIRARGNDAIEVQLPGLNTQENPDALNSLKKPAKLTFHTVHRTLYPDSTPKGEEPLGYVPMTLESQDPRTGKVYESRIFVKKIPEMGGSMVKHAYADTTQYGGFDIKLVMTDQGARRFGEITKAIADENRSPVYSSLPEDNPAKVGRLAIVLDGNLYSAPRVHEPIPGGHAVISGQFTQREALELANVLNNPLEVELKLEQMYEVGPTLADDARNASIKASILGAALVILFMLLYYRSMGLVAVITLFANVIIILGVQASLKSTLTLPGIAALVLTIGMAVDSNILIFERIREELKLGKNIQNALAAGFDRAFSTIFDANITTLLVGIILIWLGTGPIKGFGVTLSIGIGATLFCTLVISRLILDLAVKYKIMTKVLTVSLFKESHFNFLKYGKPAFIASWLIVLAGVIGVAVNYKHIYSIDFVGGDEIALSFSEKIPTQDIYKVASQNNLGEVVPSYKTLLSSKDTNKDILNIQTEHGRSEAVFQALAKAFPQSKLEIIGTTSIGSSVSSSIKTDALLAIVAGIIGMLIYIAFRFEIGYGIGAVVSTVHDVLISIGIYVLMGGQFSAPMVAAILMIIGYSINDTIVVFDRIREELILNPTTKLGDIINLAVNRTLSRTILTSATTFLAALALYIFGAGIIHDFALVFMIGIVAGTFSSIFVAAPVFYWWHKGDRKNLQTRQLTKVYEWDAGSSK